MLRSQRSILVVLVVLVAVVFRVTDTNPAVAQTQTIGAWKATAEPAMDGFAPEWQSMAPVFLPATAQQVTPPIGGGAVQRIAVRALHWDDRLYVMMEWNDPSADRFSDGYQAFTDAAAIQFPAIAGSEVPAICMGQADQAVNIWQWRADHEQDAPGLPPDAYVDLYPSTDDLYFPARAAGNPLSTEVDRTPGHNLVAGGFGTLTTTDNGGLEAHGEHLGQRWAVVFSRPLQPTGDLEPEFDPAQTVDVAFAVWDGAQMERDGIKSVSTFTQVAITSDQPPRRSVAAIGDWPAFTPPMGPLGVGLVIVIAALVAMVTGVAWIMIRHALRHARNPGRSHA